MNSYVHVLKRDDSCRKSTNRPSHKLNNHNKKRTARMAENLTNDHISSKQSSSCFSSSNSESNRTSRGKSKSEESDCRRQLRIGLFGPDCIQNKSQQNESHWKLIAGWYRVDDDWCSSFSNHNRTWWHYLFVSDKTISHRRKIRCREAGFPATHDSVVSGSKRLLTTTQTCSTRKNSLEEKLWDAAWNMHLRKRNGNTCSRARLMIQLRLLA